MSDYEKIALVLMVLGIVVGVTGVAVLVALARALVAPAPEPEPEPEPVKPGPGFVGIQRPTSQVVTGTNGLLKITDPDVTYSGVEFRCLVDVEATNAVFTDCLFSGPDVAPANSALLRTISGKGSATAVDCTFSPRVPQPTLDAVRGSNLTLTRCEITGTVDGIHIYGNLSDPADPLAGNVHAPLCWIHDLATFPSTSHADGYTHNDGVRLRVGDVHPRRRVAVQDGTYVIEDNRWDDGSQPGPTFKTGA